MDKTNPEDWTTNELFEYCHDLYLIHEEDTFDEWMNDRSTLLDIVKTDLNNN